MKWIVNIEGNTNQRIVVKFNPLEEKIDFSGQFKPHNKEWVDFYIKSVDILDINLDIIKSTLDDVYGNMERILEQYNNLNEGFQYIKEIGVIDKEE